MTLPTPKQAVALFVVVIYTATNGILAHAAEANFWSERKKASAAGRSPIQLARLPAASPLAALPAMAAPALSENLSQSLPAGFAQKHDGLLRALSTAHGSLRKVSLPAGPSQGVIVHLQDVHQNLEAQKNIGQMVLSLRSVGAAALVGLEGDAGPIDVEGARTFPDRATAEQVADRLLSEGAISGPVRAAIGGPAMALVGIDDPAAYAANVQAYRVSAPRQPAAKFWLAARRREIDAEKAHTFNPALRAYDRRVEDYRTARIGLGEYAQGLTEGAAVSPAVRRFTQAWEMERSLDFAAVERERRALVERLSERLTAAEARDLVRRGADYRAGLIGYAVFYKYLQSLCEAKGLPLSRFPVVAAYVRYVLLADSIDAQTLFADLAAAEKSGYAALAATAGEKSLVERARLQTLREKLADFALVPAEWADYAALSRGKKDWDFSAFEAFYVHAQRRDGAMAENLLAAMKAGGHRTAAAVTGGYHAAGMETRFTRAGYTVLSVAPAFEKADETGYLTVFSREKTPLEKLFAGEKLFLAQPPYPAAARFKGGLWAAARQVWLAKGGLSQAEAEAAGERFFGRKGRYRGFRFQFSGGEVVLWAGGAETLLIDQSGKLSEAVRAFSWTRPLRELPDTVAMLFTPWPAKTFINKHGPNSPETLIKLMTGLRWIRRFSAAGFAVAAAASVVAGPWAWLLLPLFHLAPHYLHNALFPEAPAMLPPAPVETGAAVLSEDLTESAAFRADPAGALRAVLDGQRGRPVLLRPVARWGSEAAGLLELLGFSPSAVPGADDLQAILKPEWVVRVEFSAPRVVVHFHESVSYRGLAVGRLSLEAKGRLFSEGSATLKTLAANTPAGTTPESRARALQALQAFVVRENLSVPLPVAFHLSDNGKEDFLKEMGGAADPGAVLSENEHAARLRAARDAVPPAPVPPSAPLPAPRRPAPVERPADNRVVTRHSYVLLIGQKAERLQAMLDQPLEPALGFEKEGEKLIRAFAAKANPDDAFALDLAARMREGIAEGKLKEKYFTIYKVTDMVDMVYRLRGLRSAVVKGFGGRRERAAVAMPLLASYLRLELGLRDEIENLFLNAGESGAEPRYVSEKTDLMNGIGEARRLSRKSRHAEVVIFHERAGGSPVMMSMPLDRYEQPETQALWEGIYKEKVWTLISRADFETVGRGYSFGSFFMLVAENETDARAAVPPQDTPRRGALASLFKTALWAVSLVAVVSDVLFSSGAAGIIAAGFAGGVAKKSPRRRIRDYASVEELIEAVKAGRRVRWARVPPPLIAALLEKAAAERGVSPAALRVQDLESPQEFLDGMTLARLSLFGQRHPARLDGPVMKVLLDYAGIPVTIDYVREQVARNDAVEWSLLPDGVVGELLRGAAEELGKAPRQLAERDFDHPFEFIGGRGMRGLYNHAVQDPRRLDSPPLSFLLARGGLRARITSPALTPTDPERIRRRAGAIAEELDELLTAIESDAAAIIQAPTRLDALARQRDRSAEIFQFVNGLRAVPDAPLRWTVTAGGTLGDTDVANPLLRIRLYLFALAGEQPGAERREEILAKIQEEVRRLDGISERLRALPDHPLIVKYDGDIPFVDLPFPRRNGNILFWGLLWLTGGLLLTAGPDAWSAAGAVAANGDHSGLLSAVIGGMALLTRAPGDVRFLQEGAAAFERAAPGVADLKLLRRVYFEEGEPRVVWRRGRIVALMPRPEVWTAAEVGKLLSLLVELEFRLQRRSPREAQSIARMVDTAYRAGALSKTDSVVHTYLAGERALRPDAPREDVRRDAAAEYARRRDVLERFLGEDPRYFLRQYPNSLALSVHELEARLTVFQALDQARARPRDLLGSFLVWNQDLLTVLLDAAGAARLDPDIVEFSRVYRSLQRGFAMENGVPLKSWVAEGPDRAPRLAAVRQRALELFVAGVPAARARGLAAAHEAEIRTAASRVAGMLNALTDDVDMFLGKIAAGEGSSLDGHEESLNKSVLELGAALRGLQPAELRETLTMGYPHADTDVPNLLMALGRDLRFLRRGEPASRAEAAEDVRRVVVRLRTISQRLVIAAAYRKVVVKPVTQAERSAFYVELPRARADQGAFGKPQGRATIPYLVALAERAGSWLGRRGVVNPATNMPWTSWDAGRYYIRNAWIEGVLFPGVYLIVFNLVDSLFPGMSAVAPSIAIAVPMYAAFSLAHYNSWGAWRRVLEKYGVTSRGREPFIVGTGYLLAVDFYVFSLTSAVPLAALAASALFWAATLAWHFRLARRPLEEREVSLFNEKGVSLMSRPIEEIVEGVNESLRGKPWNAALRGVAAGNTLLTWNDAQGPLRDWLKALFPEKFKIKTDPDRGFHMRAHVLRLNRLLLKRGLLLAMDQYASDRVPEFIFALYRVELGRFYRRNGEPLVMADIVPFGDLPEGFRPQTDHIVPYGVLVSDLAMQEEIAQSVLLRILPVGTPGPPALAGAVRQMVMKDLEFNHLIGGALAKELPGLAAAIKRVYERTGRFPDEVLTDVPGMSQRLKALTVILRALLIRGRELGELARGAASARRDPVYPILNLLAEGPLPRVELVFRLLSSLDRGVNDVMLDLIHERLFGAKTPPEREAAYQKVFVALASMTSVDLRALFRGWMMERYGEPGERESFWHTSGALSVLDPVFRAAAGALARRGKTEAAFRLDSARLAWNLSAGPWVETYLFFALPATLGLWPLAAGGVLMFAAAHAIVDAFVYPRFLGRAPPRSIWETAAWGALLSLPLVPFALGFGFEAEGALAGFALHWARNWAAGRGAWAPVPAGPGMLMAVSDDERGRARPGQPPRPGGARVSMDGHLKEAKRLMDEKRWAEARTYLDHARRQDPRNPEILRRLASVLIKLKDFKQALSLAEEAFQIDSESVSNMMTLALALRQNQQLPRAAGLLRAVLAVEPDNARARVVLGHVVSDEGNFPAAIEQFESARARLPLDFGGRLALARAYRKVGRLDAALVEVNALRELDPRSVAALQAHARVFLAFAEGARPGHGDHYSLARRDAEQALRSAEAILAINPRQGTAHVLMARALALLDRNAEALQFIERAIRLGAPDPAALHAFRNRLQDDLEEDGLATIPALASLAGKIARTLGVSPREGIRFYSRHAWFFEGVLGAGLGTVLWLRWAQPLLPDGFWPLGALVVSGLFAGAHFLPSAQARHLPVGRQALALTTALYGYAAFITAFGFAIDPAGLSPISQIFIAGFWLMALATHRIVNRVWWADRSVPAPGRDAEGLNLVALGRHGAAVELDALLPAAGPLGVSTIDGRARANYVERVHTLLDNPRYRDAFIGRLREVQRFLRPTVEGALGRLWDYVQHREGDASGQRLHMQAVTAETLPAALAMVRVFAQVPRDGGTEFSLMLMPADARTEESLRQDPAVTAAGVVVLSHGLVREKTLDVPSLNGWFESWLVGRGISADGNFSMSISLEGLSLGPWADRGLLKWDNRLSAVLRQALLAAVLVPVRTVDFQRVVELALLIGRQA